MHEDFSRAGGVTLSTDRAFGFVMAVFFSAIGLWPLMRGGVPRWWSLAVAALVLVLALVRPSLLRPANRAWAGLALILHKIVNPLVTALLFYLVFTPLGFLMRLSGKDPLRTRYDPRASSYWIPRHPPGPPPESMANQF